MDLRSQEQYEALLALLKESEEPLLLRYKRLKELFERLCSGLLVDESLQMSDLAARINYVAAKVEMNYWDRNRLHVFRISVNQVLNKRHEPTEKEFLTHLKIASFAINRFTGVSIPVTLACCLPKTVFKHPVSLQKQERVKQIRVCFLYQEGELFFVQPVNTISPDPLAVRCAKGLINEVFEPIIAKLWHHAQLNLLNCTVSAEGVYTPEFIVLEPDYMLDISALAECYKDYGSHPLNYYLSRLMPIENPLPLLLGNIANLFLDELIYHKEETVTYQSCMKKAFQRYPFELTACEALTNPETATKFFADCSMHFKQIKESIEHLFTQDAYGLDKEDAILEPSYICEALGIQGRLDYMQRDMSRFVEMKSGKADEFTVRGKVIPKENNRVQMLLYMALLEFSMGIDHRTIQPFLFYTRYPILYPATPDWAPVRRAIQLRNSIVANEHLVQQHNEIGFTERMLNCITPQTLNQRKLANRFWDLYLLPSIEQFGNQLSQLTPLERKYYCALYNFIAKELYTAKSGAGGDETRSGTASLWLSTLTEKQEAGEILYNLTIVHNGAAQEHKAFIVFEIPSFGDEFLPNFRVGDMVVLYERNTVMDNLVNKQSFKAFVEEINPTQIRIRLRATQRNAHLFPATAHYALEHDRMDIAFRQMFLGLHAFANTTAERRDLLLGLRPPVFEEREVIEECEEDLTRITNKALRAKEFFLLVGPPGTGKTSHALRSMMQAFLAKGDQLLLLAYTNRAVDEICKMLTSLESPVPFIRIGSELSCDPAYRPYLIENQLNGCERRTDVLRVIEQAHVVVGTVASISGRQELFKLKTFEVALVDEATQILEPQLLGILCAKGRQDGPAIQKFILIGDHKQLPAVVLQSDSQSEIKDPSLRTLGILNLKDSLFERLYRNHSQEANSPVLDQLTKHGRMHPEVADFPNRFFYNQQLTSLNLTHQTEELINSQRAGENLLQQLIRSQRVAFIPAVRTPLGGSHKRNSDEAQQVVAILKILVAEHGDSFDPHRTVGVITPYRNQIALIRKEIESADDPALSGVLVDTVERYQGSERDIIIYSCCVNVAYQFENLSNTIQEGSQLIDRKLNVALTRARKQLFVIGVPKVLCADPVYKALLMDLKARGGWLGEGR